MAKIIYGVSGQGFGHAARSKETIDYLKKQGHQVLIFSYNQGLAFLSKFFEVYPIVGLGLTYKENKLVYWDTVKNNAKNFLAQSRNIRKFLNRFRLFNPDLVITDFESLSAFLAKLQRVPLISLDNQHQLTNTKIKLPDEYANHLLIDRLVIKSMVWQADYYLVTSFFKTPIIKKNTFLVPPIVRSEVLKMKPQKQDYVLVYLTGDFQEIIKELKKLDQKFVVVGLKTERTEGNIEFKNFSTDTWLKYLANCRAIIANAGLSLISEALFLKKPYLALPVKKQVEQIINAQYLEQLGYGLAANRFSVRAFKEFMNNLESYERKLKNYPYHDNQVTFKKLEELIAKLT